MTAEHRSSTTRRDLRAIVADGVAFSLMVGLGETYVPAFALALGMSEVVAGWVVAIPLLAGAVVQLVSPRAVERLGSHRRWVVACAATQALTFGGFLLMAVRGAAPDVAVFLVAAAYWGSGMATGPAWNTWVGTLVPRPLRAHFFARRNRFAQAALLTGVIAAGVALQLGAARGVRLSVFAGLFAAAAACRVVSTFLLASQSEPRPLPENHRRVSVPEWLRRVRHGRDGRLLVYLLVVQTAVQISGPFFTPYMLGQLRFSYGEYLLVIATSFGAKMLMLPLLGRVARRLGARRLLVAAGLALIPLPALWIVSPTVGWLLVVQVIAGTVWAAYELTTFLLLFDHVDESERTSVLTTFNLASAVATIAGAFVGGMVLRAGGLDRDAYRLLFAVSTGARFLAIPFLLRLGGPEPSRWRSVLPRVLGIRPGTGSLDAPLVAGLGDRKGEA